MKQSTYPAFMAVMRGMGKENKQDACFKIYNGGTVWFRTAHDPDSIVGITNVRGIWGDEAGKYPLYFWENLQARASFKQCPIILTTSPYSLNWVYKELIRPYNKGTRRDDLCLIQAASNESPHFPQVEYERKKKTMDPRRFKMVYGGLFDKAEGLVYDCFDEDENQVTTLNLETGVRYVGGIDWGYNHPFVIKIRAIDMNGNHWDVSEFYKTQMTVSQICEVVKQKHLVYNVERFWCDPSRPDYIAELQSPKWKVPALAADNSIIKGVDAHYQLIKSRQYKILKGACPHTIDELESYHYPEPKDLKVDQDEDSEDVDTPVDQNNHCMDADRYITMMTRANAVTIPNVPGEKDKRVQGESMQAKIRRLKRLRENNHSENYS